MSRATASYPRKDKEEEEGRKGVSVGGKKGSKEGGTKGADEEEEEGRKGGKE